ncbi:MAG: hypothetical protein IJ132_01010 [Firmicutes bacterium]|nr:hypothetical protein [Bacillota bacterium]
MKKLFERFIVIALIASLFVISPLPAGQAYAADDKPASTSITKYSITKTYFTVNWKKVDKVSGYQIQYCMDRFFLNPTTVKVEDPSVTSKRVSLKSFSPCYIRVRTYKTTADKTLYSSWAVSGNTKVSKEAIIVRVTKPDGKEFELRSAAKQKMKKYDTLQGGCAYGDYGWFILYNRNVNKCKLAKVKMKTMEVVKVSGVLAVSHGSSVAYNPNTKELAVCHGPYNYKKVSIIDPNTLAVKSTVTLSLPTGTKGATKKQCRNFSGITALTYNNEHKVYVARLKAQGNLVYFNSKFKAVKYVKLSYYGGQMYQGIESIGDYNLVSSSPYRGGKYNKITVYDWKGKYQSTVRLCKRYEVETIFHRDKALYAGYYRSCYKTYYLDKWKIKVYKGKKTKIKTRLKYSTLVRDNYIFKVTDL